jgi:hypothetical protein
MDPLPMSNSDRSSVELRNFHERNCACGSFKLCINPFARCVINRRMYHSLRYAKRHLSVSYLVQYRSNDSHHRRFGKIHIFFSHNQQTWVLIQIYKELGGLSEYLKAGTHYQLIRQPLDSFYIIVTETSEFRVLSAERIVNHLIVFEGIIEHPAVLVTPVSSSFEHD